MMPGRGYRRAVFTRLGGFGLCLALVWPGATGAQERLSPPAAAAPSPTRLSVPPVNPVPGACDKPLPIDLPTALRLAGVRPIDIAVAAARIRLAAAELDQARVLWLPNLVLGIDYFRHDGQIQDVAGNVFGTSKNAFMVGAGPVGVFALSDAFFGPLAQRQVLRARQAELQAARNDSLEAVAEAYFNLQQARGELAGAADAARRAGQVARKTQGLAGGLVSPVEAVRARAELAHRRQAVHSALERWRTASAELVRLLRLDATVVVDPVEPPHLRVDLIEPGHTVDDLVVLGLTNRPELATRQALVQATLVRLRQERLRPLVPSILLRGASTNPAGTLAVGGFGGGLNDNFNHFGGRFDLDVQVLWELQNLGLGNRARVGQREAEHERSVLELFRTQDRVAAEVAQAFAQLRSAAARWAEAEAGLKDAAESADRNYQGLGQTRGAGGGVLLLVIRPQEAVQAVQALAQAYADYYAAAGDYNRAQFRLYRALGRPAQALTGGKPACPAPVPPAHLPPGSREPSRPHGSTPAVAPG